MNTKRTDSDAPLIYIVDDEPDVRLAVSLLMQSIGLETQCFANAREFWDALDPQQPGCIVLDVRMPGMSGIELQAQLTTLPYHPPIIMVSGHGEVPTVVRAMKSGALDFLQKPYSDQDLIDRVHRAIAIDEQRRAAHASRQHAMKLVQSLTPRECDVMQRVVRGVMNKVIAADLGVSTRTVEIHRAHVMDKLQVRSLAELIRLVSNAGAPGATNLDTTIAALGADNTQSSP